MIIALTEEQKTTLLKYARKSIEYGYAHKECMTADASLLKNEAFSQVASTFVTLKLQSEAEEDPLRGCVGSITATMPLIQDVINHAYSAAFEDGRFRPVMRSEIPKLAISISILSPMEELTFTDEEQLLEQLRPNIDGLYVLAHGRRATFLPSVWEQIPCKLAFLQQLKMKAGLPSEYWDEDFCAYRYQTIYFQE